MAVGGRDDQKGGEIRKHRAGPRCCTAETQQCKATLLQFKTISEI